MITRKNIKYEIEWGTESGDNDMTQQKPHNPLWNVKKLLKLCLSICCCRIQSKALKILLWSNLLLRIQWMFKYDFDYVDVTAEWMKKKKKHINTHTMNQNVINGMRMRNTRVDREQPQKSFNSFRWIAMREHSIFVNVVSFQ